MKLVFLKISQNSQKTTCARVSFLIKFQTTNSFLNIFSFGLSSVIFKVTVADLSMYLFAEKCIE